MSTPGETLSHAIQERVVQEALFVIKALDWAKLTAKVEFKHAPGLFARARIATVSGAGGTLYPPLKVGDVVKGEIHGPDLTEMIETKVARNPRNPHLYDLTDVSISLSVYAESGEPAGRKATTPPNPGEWLLVNAAGAEVRIPEIGDVVVKPAPGRKVYIGGTTNAKAVLVNGDSNAAGGVSSTQSTLYVGS